MIQLIAILIIILCLVFFFQTFFLLLKIIWNLILGVFEIIYKLISPFISWFPKALTSESAFDLAMSWTIVACIVAIILGVMSQKVINNLKK